MLTVANQCHSLVLLSIPSCPNLTSGLTEPSEQQLASETTTAATSRYKHLLFIFLSQIGRFYHILGQVMRNIWISICVTVIAVFLITDFDQILQILKYCLVIFSISFCIIGTVVLTVLVNILTSPKVTLNRF